MKEESEIDSESLGGGAQMEREEEGWKNRETETEGRREGDMGKLEIRQQ